MAQTAQPGWPKGGLVTVLERIASYGNTGGRGAARAANDEDDATTRVVGMPLERWRQNIREANNHVIISTGAFDQKQAEYDALAANLEGILNEERQKLAEAERRADNLKAQAWEEVEKAQAEVEETKRRLLELQIAFKRVLDNEALLPITDHRPLAIEQKEETP